MFGFSFGEILVISLVTLVAVGPQKLPGMLKTMGLWARKLRKMTMDVRQQTGIDEMLRAEGIQISELRTLMRGYHGGPFAAAAPAPAPAPAPTPSPTPSPHYDDPYGGFEPDPTREYPPEGADAYGALPDDLLEPATSSAVADAPGPPDPKPELVPAPELAPEPVVAADPESVTADTVAASQPASVPTSEFVVATSEPVVATSEPVVATSEPVVAAALPQPVRSVPPPPPSSRAVNAVPRPAGTPPPPPRRTMPPRPESSPLNKSEAPAAAPVPPRPGTPNGNG